MQRYIIGKSPIPEWCRNQLYQYKRMDGSTGFEWWYEADCMIRQAELVAGDELVLMNGRVTFRRNHEN